MPANAAGFCCVYNIFFHADQTEDDELQARRERRIVVLNDDIVTYVIDCMAASVARKQPFYILCGVEIASGSAESFRCLDRLRLALQQLGVEHNTLLLQRSDGAARPHTKAA